MPVKLDIVTAEATVFSDTVDAVVAPGSEGELGVLPHHAPLMSILKPGSLTIRKGGVETYFAVSGGFLEVRPDKVVVLADTAERAEAIDEKRASEARERARQRLAHPAKGIDMARAEAAMARSLARIQAAEKAKRKVRQA